MLTMLAATAPLSLSSNKQKDAEINHLYQLFRLVGQTIHVLHLLPAQNQLFDNVFVRV